MAIQGSPGSRPSSLSYLGNQGWEGGPAGRNATGTRLLLGAALVAAILETDIPLRPWLGGLFAPKALPDPQGSPSPEGLGAQPGGESGRAFLSRKNLGRAGPKVPTGLLNQAGDRQCSLSEPRGGGSQQSRKGHAGATDGGMRGHGGGRGHAERGASSMSSTPRGPGWAPGPLGRTHPVCPSLQALDWHHRLQPRPSGSRLASQPVCTRSSGVRSSAAPNSSPFLSTEAEGKLAPSLPALPVDSALCSAGLWIKPGGTPPLPVTVGCPLHPALTTQELDWGPACHLPSSNCILTALKAGTGPGAPAVFGAGVPKGRGNEWRMDVFALLCPPTHEPATPQGGRLAELLRVGAHPQGCPVLLARTPAQWPCGTRTGQSEDRCLSLGQTTQADPPRWEESRRLARLGHRYRF